MTIRLLMVEDHTAFGQALSALAAFETDISVDAVVTSGSQAIESPSTDHIDVALVDLDLPDIAGIDVLAALLRRQAAPKCIVLTASTNAIELGKCVEAGAAAVLHKSIEISELFDVIRAVASGQTRLDAADVASWLQALAAFREQQWRARTVGDLLSPREQDILRLLANGLRATAIADKLRISPGTVNTHIRNLRAKLGVSTQLDAVLEGQRLGLVDTQADRLPRF